MNSKQIRQKFLEFFEEKAHKEIPSASLVPENDPSVLFVTAGMHPLVPYLMGEKHPLGKRIVNIQKCVRTGDIDDVGDSAHNTFFEMLGNWSFGNYFKNESIQWSWEFLTDKKWLGISPEKIKVTVFEGDSDAPRDDESIKIWKKCFKKSGISFEVYNKEKKNNESARIFPLPKEDNWWGPAGKTGPCGPDTEIFIDLRKSVNFEKCPNGEDCKPGCNCGRYVEIWNNVFMEYNKTSDGKYVPLKQKNVDTGMGMERTLAILNRFNNVYETDLLAPIIAEVERLSEKKCNESESIKKSTRIIVDHIRTSVFMISDGVAPSNLDRGYVLRRLLRRAIIHGRNLKMPKNFLLPLVDIVINIYKEFYPELSENKNKILNEIKKEEEKFEKTIERGIKELKKIYGMAIGGMDPENLPEGAVIQNNVMRADGNKIFYIYQTYGLPIEISQEIMNKWGIAFDKQTMQEAKKAFKKHQELSRTASAGKFKGGLADASEETKKLHTAAHLLLESLRIILGNHIYQKGSNITAERLRFDFSHP
jgi:alanyl-tRNA synthetase